MAVYLKTIEKKLPERAATIRANIEQMKAWERAGQ
jgi:hypothetical protein